MPSQLPSQLKTYAAWTFNKVEAGTFRRNKRDFAWIMAQTPQIPEDDYQKMVLELTAHGYDVAKLRKVPHRWPAKP